LLEKKIKNLGMFKREREFCYEIIQFIGNRLQNEVENIKYYCYEDNVNNFPIDLYFLELLIDFNTLLKWYAEIKCKTHKYSIYSDYSDEEEKEEEKEEEDEEEEDDEYDEDVDVEALDILRGIEYRIKKGKKTMATQKYFESTNDR
jgi:hypothetical protein